LDILQWARINHPHYLETGFPLSKLHANNVSSSQWMFDAGKLGAMFTDVAGVRVLKKGTTVSAHPPDTNQEVDIDTGLGLIRHAAEVPQPREMIPS
jgi:hypothetical protein